MKAQDGVGGLSMHTTFLKIGIRVFEKKKLNFLQSVSKKKIKNPIPKIFIQPVLSNKNSRQTCQARYLEFKISCLACLPRILDR